MDRDRAELRRLLRKQSGVIARRQIPASLRGMVRHRVDSGRWQRPHDGIVVRHNGVLTYPQRIWVAVLAAGPGAAACGPTAAQLGGLEGFESTVVHVSIVHKQRGPAVSGVRYHRSRRRASDELIADHDPPRIALAYALIDMATSAKSDELAHHVLTSAVQQRLIRTSALAAALGNKTNLRRRSAIAETLLDIDDGAQSMNEVAMRRLIAEHGFPPPDLQIAAATERRRSRVDGGWPQFAVCFEIDGVGHFEVGKWIDDADRQNEVALARPAGTTLLRWPGFVVRRQSEIVVDQVHRALIRGGWSPP